MYLKAFKLREEPFATTPDPRFLYKSRMHHEALERISYAVQARRGINAIIGEPGLGKSTLIRKMLNGLSSNVHYAWVFNTTLTPKELLKYICRDFGFTPKGQDMSDLLMELYEYLIGIYEQGKYAILIIDEAQNLQPDLLEYVRQMSNLETSNKKLLQVLLSGQPDLDHHLNHPKLHQIKQRICLKAVLSRMDLRDTKSYIQHRLNVAGTSREDIFTPAAMDIIYEISDGIPRLVNQICDNALMHAAKEKHTQVDSQFIHVLVKENKITHATVTKNPLKSQLSLFEQNAPVPVTEHIKDRGEEDAIVVEEAHEGFDVLDLGQLAIG